MGTDNSSGNSSDDTGEVETGAEPAWRRRQRLAEIFGDVLPSVTRDEKEPGETDGAGAGAESASERWLKAQVPPHHGT